MSSADVMPHCASVLICAVEERWTCASVRPGSKVQFEPSTTSDSESAGREETILPLEMWTDLGDERL